METRPIKRDTRFSSHRSASRFRRPSPISVEPGSTLARSVAKYVPRNNSSDDDYAEEKLDGPRLRTIPVAFESPWDKYNPAFKIQFGGEESYTVAEREREPKSEDGTRLALVKQVRDLKSNEFTRVVEHACIVACQDVFHKAGHFYIVYSFMPLSLSQLQANPLLTEKSLAAILRQIVDGLSFLESKGLEHGQISSSSILVDLHGTVKICGCENLRDRGGPSDIRALSFVMMELMQGYRKDGDTVGIDNLHRWPLSSDAIGFLSATTSATSTSQLLAHPLLKPVLCKSDIICPANLANAWSSRGFEFPAVIEH